VTGPDGVQRVVYQLAGEFDPQLVAGGKGAARAVEGIPFVVAWSPDSKTFAFGSITGDPYVLGLMRYPGSVQPQLTFAEVTGGYVGELAWSPDGKLLAISTYALDRRNHTVLMADPVSGSIRKLIDGCHITWAPDSKYIAIHRDPGVESGAWVVSATDSEDRWPISREVKAFPLTWE
jgi:Tol biopolymer transport system component